MTTIDDDVELEPFDVLLEEVAQELPERDAAVAAGSPRRRWLAAAIVLLGATAVLGTVWLQRGERTVVPAQEPRPAPAAQDPQPAPAPPEQNPMQALLRLEELRRGAAKASINELRGKLAADPDGIGDRGKRGALLQQVSGIRFQVVDVGDGRALPGAEREIAADRVTAVCAWIDEALGDSPGLGGWSGDGNPFVCQLVLRCSDERQHVVQLLLGERPILFWRPYLACPAEGPVLDELRRLHAEATRQGRSQRGEADSLDELRALPATVTAIRCPCLTAEQARGELPRFERLERLAFVEQGLCQLPHGETVVVIARLRTLRALELPAGALDDDDLREFATLPEIDELALTGAGTKVTADGLAALQHLTTLRLLVRDCDPRVVDALKRLPRLRTFAADGPWFRDEQIDALLPTKIASLELASGDFGSLGPTDTWITAAGLRRLAGLPSLRQLVLVQPRLDDSGIAALQGAPQLRRLVLRGATTHFARDGANNLKPDFAFGVGSAGQRFVERLRADLPQCEVVHEVLPAAPVLRKG